ncbi:MAG TPA: ATP-binding protein [Planosporangium sp.]|nr:ATP-binding protein [Planosporangium sp.]
MTEHLSGATSPGVDHDGWLEGRRQRLRTAREWLLAGGSALLYGPVGAGKSAALDLVTAAAIQSRVLRCAPTESDADHRFAALVGLLGSITPAERDAVAVSRRQVLGAATPDDLDPVAPAAVRLAVLSLFRTLARSRPLLLVVDDLQWVDEASADVLRFVSSRVDDVPVQLVAAERVEPDCLPLRRPLCPSPLLVVRLEPVGC